jgi:exodeoxyribonuclease-3
MDNPLTVASWNVNSIKVRLPQVVAWLRSRQPDLLALQELKAITADFPVQAFAEIGYQAAVHGQKAYNGVALLSRSPLADIETDLPGAPGDDQARIVAGTLADIRVINVYAPNGQEVGSDKYAYKLSWFDALAQHLAARRRPDDPLLVLGDFNVAPDERDVYDPEVFRGEILFSDQERAALRRLVDWGLVDVFRQFHSEGKQFSWWDYRMNAFRRNLGARIDLVLATRPLAARARACEIDKEPRRKEQPSDHAPIVAVFSPPS